MTARQFWALPVVSSIYWVWPVALFLRGRNVLVSLAALGVELISGAILLYFILRKLDVPVGSHKEGAAKFHIG